MSEGYLGWDFEQNFDLPLRQSEPTLFRVVEDLFDERLTRETITPVYAAMQLAQRHTFQVVTGRPDRALDFYQWLGTKPGRSAWLRAVVGVPPSSIESWSTAWSFRNIQLGVHAKTQAEVRELSPALFQCPAAAFLLELTPVEHIDLAEWLVEPVKFCQACGWWPVEGKPRYREIHGEEAQCLQCKTPMDGLRRFDGVTVAGEHGPNSLPMHPDWVCSIRDQCETAGVPFCFEGWGDWCPRQDGHVIDDEVPRVRLTICGCNGQSDVARHGVRGSYTSAHECDTSNDSWVNKVGKECSGRHLGGVVYDARPSAAHRRT